MCIRDRFETEEINTAIARSLSDIESLDVAVDISGTLASPSWQMRSNLGAHMAGRLRDAVHTHLANRNEEQLRTAHEQIDTRVRNMETELLAKQQLILESLQFDTAEIEKVRNDIARRVESTDGVIDPESPLRETFRR